MSSAQDTSFARLVSLACHDLRTPLATVFGFARTLSKSGDLQEPASRYVEMIETASGQLGELLDLLGIAARIESGRWQPTLGEVDTLDLARGAAETLGEERVEVSGAGGKVQVEADAARRAVSSLARCALRHGGFEQVRVRAEGKELKIDPITPASAPVVLGDDLRDLGAAVAVKVVEALGGSVSVEDDALSVRL